MELNDIDKNIDRNNQYCDKQEGLLRLFQSSIFDMDLAIQYLSKYNDYGVQSFIVNKFFSFCDKSVDFFFSQLVCLFVAYPHLDDVLKSYFTYRCSTSVEYSVLLVWLLDSYSNIAESPFVDNAYSSSTSLDNHMFHDNDRVIKFRNAIVHGFLNIQGNSQKEWLKLHSNEEFLSIYKNHKRSTSDLSGLNRKHSDEKSIKSFDHDMTVNNFYIGDKINVDDQVFNSDVNFQSQLSYKSSVQLSLASKSIESLPDLLSGHAFDNFCLRCNKHAVNNPLFNHRTLSTLRHGSTLSLPANCKSYSNNHNGKDYTTFDKHNGKPSMISNCCNSSAYFIEPQWNFVKTLVSISQKLTRFPSKEQKTNHLRAELAHLNLNLPARVWIPIEGSNHYVIRIPPNAAVCLNSKTRAPYLIYVEIISNANPFFDELIQKKQISLSNDKFNSSYCSLQDVDCSNASQYAKDIIDNEISNGLDIEDEAYVAAGDIRRRLHDNVLLQKPEETRKISDDPSVSVLFEPWHLKVERIKDASPYGKLENWHLLSVIVKHGDDLRQEQLAYQILRMFQKIWSAERTPLWLRPLNIAVISAQSGMIEPVLNAVSIHQIKRLHAGATLKDYFLSQFGPSNSEIYLNSQKNFVESCAAYSLICYLLQVKDRHNGNILLDDEGHMIHIDYGFILSSSPGRNLGFEFSPFKLTYEEVQIMGGVKSDMFEYFKILILQGLLAARKHMDKILALIEILDRVPFKLPCFTKDFDSVYNNFRDRFHLHKTEEQLQMFVDGMVDNSLHSLTTRLYDSFQYYTNGIQ